TLEYNVTLPAGTTIGTLPAVTYTTAANATAVKTDATALPGTTLIAVTAQDGIASQTYKINFTVSTVQSQTITFTLPTGKVYGDADFDITGITSGGSGNPVQFASSNTAVATVSGNTIKILAAGTTTITATQAGNGSYADATPVQHDLVVGQATATVSLNGLSATYDATAKTVTASTTPTGLTVNITYAGSTTAPTNAGTYAIVATINDPNYKGSATDNLVINKATATVTLNGLSTTYDATAKTVTAGTTPTSLTVNITYNGSVTAPANAGTYPIVATVNDVNYTGTASDNLVIAKAPLTVTTEPATRMKGLANPAFVLKFTGFQGSDTKSVINPQPTATCSADASSVVGDYAVVVTGGTADNYTITYVNGTLTITVNTGTKSINGAEVKAYPNPVVSGKLNIEVPSFDKKSAITVTSTSGAQVIARKIDSNVTELNLTNVAPGLYIVRIETPDGVSIQQIVKQ
ncbi:MAG TPA: MBG domain-containing protein, partial [Bacteroidales bacterium]